MAPPATATHASQDQSCSGRLMSMQYIKHYTTYDSPEWCSAEKSSSTLNTAVSLLLLLCPSWPLAAPEASELHVVEVTGSQRVVLHSVSDTPRKHLKIFSPGEAVAGEGVAAPRTVARTAAILVKPPVSRSTAVAAGATNAGLTRALPACGVARQGGAEWMAGTSCG